MASSFLMNPVLERMSSAEQKTARPLGFSSFGTRNMGRKFNGDRFIAWMNMSLQILFCKKGRLSKIRLLSPSKGSNPAQLFWEQ